MDKPLVSTKTAKRLQKFLSVGLAVTTTLWLSGFVLLVPMFVLHAVTVNEGDLIRGPDGIKVYIVNAKGYKRHIFNPAVFGMYGHLKWENIKSVDQATLDSYTTSDIYRAAGDTKVYQTAQDGIKKWFDMTAEQFVVSGYSWDQVFIVNGTERDYYTTGTSITYGVAPTPVAAGLTVALASDTPAGVAIPKGAANVSFLKFNVSGSATINTITVKRTGAGATTDFSNVYLYDGVSRLTAGRSVNSTTHEATFTGLNLAISGTKTLTITADIATGAGAANRDAFQVSSISGTVTASGLPVSGNEMTISGATSGTLTATKIGSIANPNIGQQAAESSWFRLAAATEDVKVTHISLFYSGTVSKTNLSNFVLKDTAGAVLATAASLNAKDLAVFDLSANPVTILKGDNKDFKVYVNIAGAAKKDETIKLYVDEASDILAIGQQYMQGVTVTKTSFDSDAADHHVLTLQGGTLTTTFSGPTTGDIKKNGKDVTLFTFTMASANNLEVRKLNASVATTAGLLVGDSALSDFKVVDTSTGLVVAGPVDLAIADINSGKGYIFTDIFNINAGQSRNFKITADIPSDWDDADAIRVSLTPFAAGADIKNLDNNTFLVAAEIVPSTVLSGNVQTVKAPSVELSLAGLPISQSFVKGTQNVPFVGFGLRAIADDIKITTIRITATSSSVTDDDMIADLQNLALYDGNTKVSDIKSLTSSDASSAIATFSNLSYVIPKGASKVLTVKGNLSSTAVTNNKYEIGLATATVTNNTTGSHLVAVDTEGNEPMYIGSFAGSGVNMASTVQVTVLSAGTINAVVAPDDSESKAGVITTSASNTVLSKFKFTASNEALTVKKLKLLINNESSTAAAATSTAEISKVYLYDGSTQIGSTAGYTPIGSGSAAGEVVIEDLSWLIGKDSSKILTVKADTNTVAAGATSGRSIYAHLRPTGFEASGTVGSITSNGAAGGAKGNQKVLYKTYPGVTVASAGTLLTSGSNDLIKFTVTNKSSNEQLSWNVVSFNVSAASATAPLYKVSGAFDPAASFTLRDLTNNVNLTIGTTATAGTSTAGQYTLILTNEEQIPAGGSREYRITGSVIAPGSNSSISTQLVLRADVTTASILKGAAWRDAITSLADSTTGVDTAIDGTDSGLVWSDNSATGHSLTTTDWANGVFVDTFPSDTISRSN